jgi:hypothetical protein
VHLFGLATSTLALAMGSAALSAGFVLSAAPAAASRTRKLLIWLAATYLFMTTLTELAGNFNALAIPALSASIPYITVRYGSSPWGTVPFFLEGAVMVIGGLAAGYVISRRIDWRALANWSDWRVADARRWFVVVAAVSLLYWPFQVLASAVKWAIWLPAMSDAPDLSLHVMMSGLQNAWVLAYVVALLPAVRLSGAVIQRRREGSSDAPLQPLDTLLFGVLAAGVLGAGLAAALRNLPGAVLPLAGIQGAGIGETPWQWFRLLLGILVITAAPLCNWRRMEARLGVPISTPVRALLVMSVGTWVLWPLAYADVFIQVGAVLVEPPIRLFQQLLSIRLLLAVLAAAILYYVLFVFDPNAGE